MAQLDNCHHCGSVVEFVTEKPGMAESVFAKCTHCGIRTPSVPASLEYSAMDRVADVWNSSSSEEWSEWVQPTGAHDAYAYGAKVSHKGGHWISNTANNVWEPGVSGWTRQ